MLQDQILGPILGIGDPRRDKRVDFVGGIRGTASWSGGSIRRHRGRAPLYPDDIEQLWRWPTQAC